MIEDERETVTLAKLILEREGFEVIGAYSGADGLAILDQEDSNIDLVLLDIMMIGMDGWQVLEEIRASKQHAQLPVIMLTARHYLDNEPEAASYADLYDGYIDKPIMVTELVGKIRRLIQNQSD
jgi:DNA-binding response OmpR family regulator